MPKAPFISGGLGETLEGKDHRRNHLPKAQGTGAKRHNGRRRLSNMPRIGENGSPENSHNSMIAFGRLASARGSGGSKCRWGLLCGFADQYAVGGRSCAGADAEQDIEGSMPCPAPIEAEHVRRLPLVHARIRSRLNSARPPRMLSINRSCAVAVSAHLSSREQKSTLLPAMA